MNDKLLAISQAAASDLQTFINEKSDEILAAWHAAEEEAQLQETTPKFRLGFSIVLDLDKNAMETALAWSVRQKASRTQAMPDQPQLNLQNV